MFFLSLITKIELTVGTSVGLQSESDPPAEIPVQGEEAEESSHRRLLQLVLNHTVSVTVPWKSLGTHRCGGNIDQHLQHTDGADERPSISQSQHSYNLRYCLWWYKFQNQNRPDSSSTDQSCEEPEQKPTVSWYFRHRLSPGEVTNDTTGRPVLVRSWFLSLM